MILDERIERFLAATVPYHDHGKLALEIDERFQDQVLPTEFLERALRIRAGPQHGLALPVITQTPGLEHGGQSDPFNGRVQIGSTINRGKRGRVDAELAKEVFLGEPVLGNFQGAWPWTNRNALRQEAHGIERDVFPL